MDSKIMVYTKVLAALAVATIIEVIVGTNAGAWGMGEWTKFLILFAIAIFKASLIIAFFMHVKYEPKPLYLVLLVFGAPMAITLPIALFPIFFA